MGREVVHRALHVLGGALDVERHHELGRLVGLLRELAAVDVGGQGHEALRRESVAGLLDLVVHAPPLLEHDHTPAGPAVGQRQVPLTFRTVGCELHDLAH